LSSSTSPPGPLSFGRGGERKRGRLPREISCCRNPLLWERVRSSAGEVKKFYGNIDNKEINK